MYLSGIEIISIVALVITGVVYLYSMVFFYVKGFNEMFRIEAFERSSTVDLMNWSYIIVFCILSGVVLGIIITKVSQKLLQSRYNKIVDKEVDRLTNNSRVGMSKEEVIREIGSRFKGVSKSCDKVCLSYGRYDKKPYARVEFLFDENGLVRVERNV